MEKESMTKKELFVLGNAMYKFAVLVIVYAIGSKLFNQTGFIVLTGLLALGVAGIGMFISSAFSNLTEKD